MPEVNELSYDWDNAFTRLREMFQQKFPKEPGHSMDSTSCSACGDLDGCHLPAKIRDGTNVSASLSFDRLRKVSHERCKRWHPPGSLPWTAADWSNATCGEAGEMANVIKKIRRHETGAANKGDPPMEVLLDMVALEIADVVIYCDLLADYLGIDLEEAVRKKFNAVSERQGFPERL